MTRTKPLDLKGLTEDTMEGTSDKEKSDRAARFQGFLSRHRMPRHGAASAIADSIGLTPATVSAWIRGSLPRDPVVLFKFCDAYDVDPHYWVSGFGRPRAGLDASRLIIASGKLESSINRLGTALTERQRLVLLADVYNDTERGIDRLEQLSSLLDESKDQP